MKKIFGIILMLILLCIAVTALAGVQITDPETFPDENFRKFLMTLDDDGDGWVIPSGIKEMNCSGREIASLSGICNFSDLEKLDCSNNKLQSVFTENLEKLRTLNCSGNPMSTLDITKNPFMQALNISNTNITSLDVIKGSNLAKAAACEPVAYGSAYLWKDPDSGCWIIANANTVFKEIDNGQSGGEDDTEAEMTINAGSTTSVSGKCDTNHLNVGDLFGVSSNPAVLSVEKVSVAMRLDAPMRVYFVFLVTFRGVSQGTATISIYDTTYKTTCYWTKTVKVIGGDAPEPPPSLDYVVTVTAEGKGSASASPASGPEGTEVTLTATPDEGHQFKEWQVLSGGVTITDNKFTIGKADVEIKAVFEKIIYDISKAEIGAIKDQAYTGKAITPKLTVTLGGRTLIQDTDYSVAYTNNKEIGKAEVKITGAGDYTGTNSASFLIVPNKVASPKLSAGKKSLILKWKAGKGIDGYEIEYGLKKDFKGAKKITVKKADTVSYEIKKLKAKKTYYVRIRTFKKVKGNTLYSEWSKTLSKKTK